MIATLKGSNKTLLPFSELKRFDLFLGFRSFHSLHPRLNKLVAFGHS